MRSEEDKMRQIIIIGSGPAGLTAAIYAARANMRPLVIEGMKRGGQLTETAEVENFPGFTEPVAGMTLMEAMRSQAERAGVEFLLDEVTGVDFGGEVKKLTTMIGSTLEAKAVIICTGAAARWTLLPGETVYRARGISACATCDGAFYRGKEVAVIGGGDTAITDALYLARLCKMVTVVHRRDEFRAAKELVLRAQRTENIKFRCACTVDEFLGDGKRLTGLRLRNVKTGATDEIALAGAFVAIGHEPATKFLAGAVPLDEHGYVIVEHQRTSVKGVFAAGDCADARYRQAVIAAGAGAMAALEAEAYLVRGV